MKHLILIKDYVVLEKNCTARSLRFCIAGTCKKNDIKRAVIEQGHQNSFLSIQFDYWMSWLQSMLWSCKQFLTTAKNHCFFLVTFFWWKLLGFGQRLGDVCSWRSGVFELPKSGDFESNFEGRSTWMFQKKPFTVFFCRCFFFPSSKHHVKREFLRWWLSSTPWRKNRPRYSFFSYLPPTSSWPSWIPFPSGFFMVHGKSVKTKRFPNPPIPKFNHWKLKSYPNPKGK